MIESKSRQGHRSGEDENYVLPSMPELAVFTNQPQSLLAMSRQNGKILIAVDGGGTRTRCAVFDQNGEIRTSTETGPSNHLVIGSKLALESLAAAIANVLHECGADRKDVGVVSVGLAGVDVGGEGLVEAKECFRHLGFENCMISADIVTAHAGAFDGESGVLALSGTGSAFFGVSEEGRQLKVGGWGPAYGDEGSAHWIGKMALQAAAAAYDGRQPGTLLVDSICEALDLRDFSETLECIYRSPMRVRLIAALSQTADAVAAAGDLIARGILEKAGEELANGAEAVARTLGFSDRECQVAWEGAVLRNSTIVRDSFCSSLAWRLPGASIAAPLFDPIHGAYRIGCRTLGWEIAKR